MQLENEASQCATETEKTFAYNMNRHEISLSTDGILFLERKLCLQNGQQQLSVKDGQLPNIGKSFQHHYPIFRIEPFQQRLQNDDSSSDHD